MRIYPIGDSLVLLKNVIKLFVMHVNMSEKSHRRRGAQLLEKNKYKGTVEKLDTMDSISR